MVGGMHGREGMCGRGGHAWQGGDVVGACMAGGHAWQGGVCGRGACMAGGNVWQILQDMVNERVVRRILLECILVTFWF